MPLGNLTSQFFANVYLNELDQFVKHELKIKYYIRYVDDFVIFHKDKTVLEHYKTEIDNFLKGNLLLILHPEKSKIIGLNKGICFLGFRIFFFHKLLKKNNVNRFRAKLLKFKRSFKNKYIAYDKIYTCFEGWINCTKTANTYNLRLKTTKAFEQLFPNEISNIEVNRLLKQCG